MFTLSLHPSRSNRHCLNQHKLRSSVVCSVYILKLCTVCNVKRRVSMGIPWTCAHVKHHFFNRHMAPGRQAASHFAVVLLCA